MNVRIEDSWKRLLMQEWGKPYFKELTDFVRAEYGRGTVYPPATKIFAAFDSCPADSVKVVIIGQDPYHGPGQANGLSFSVNPGIAVPRSLVNIFKEVKADVGESSILGGDLSPWTQQGVLLLNSILTVRAHEAGSHQGRGWEQFTDAVIRNLSEVKNNLVFLLWGSYAIKKGAMIDRSKHLVLTSAHPSPLSASRGFFGNHHFSRANEYLVSNGKTPVVW